MCFTECPYTMRTFLVILCFFFLQPLFGQQFLRIETTGKTKIEKVGIGQEITYRLKGDKEWQTGYLERLIFEEDIVIFSDRFVKLNDIEAFRFQRRAAKPLGRTLYQFAAAWVVYGGIATLVSEVDNDPDTDWRPGTFDYSVVGGSIGLGLFLDKIFHHRVVRFGKRKRLRIVDLKVD